MRRAKPPVAGGAAGDLNDSAGLDEGAGAIVDEAVDGSAGAVVEVLDPTVLDPAFFPSGCHPALLTSPCKYFPYWLPREERISSRSTNGSSSTKLEMNELIETFKPRMAR